MNKASSENQDIKKPSLKIKRKDISKIIEAGIKKRRTKERRLKIYGISSILISFAFLFILFSSIITSGYSAFFQTKVKLDVTFFNDAIDENNFYKITYGSIRNAFPEVLSRQDKGALYSLFSRIVPHDLRDELKNNPQYKGETVSLWVTSSSKFEQKLYNRNIKQSAALLWAMALL